MSTSKSAQTLDHLRQQLRLSGPLSSPELCRALKLSQPQLSRYLAQLTPMEVEVVRQGRTRLYYLRRQVEGIGIEVPVHSVDITGAVSKLGTLSPVYPRGMLWRAEGQQNSDWSSDLPYFLQDLRPSGFLGRMIPRQLPEWNFPNDVRLWSADVVLRYLVNFGHDQVGNLIVGEVALRKYLEQLRTKPAKRTSDIEHFESLAEEVLVYGIPGSSAAGEHPKFLTSRPSDGKEVLVKFAPIGNAATALRRQDLLVCENIALDVYSEFNSQPRLSRIVRGTANLFFEIQRFDRHLPRGRSGLITLASLDNEFLGSGQSWSKAIQTPGAALTLENKVVDEIFLREFFGSLIGNSDMHSGNLSFYFENQEVRGLAPLYDMLPMRYAPYQDHLLNTPIEGLVPVPERIEVWDKAYAMAENFWSRTSQSTLISNGFRTIARSNLKVLKELADVRRAIN